VWRNNDYVDCCSHFLGSIFYHVMDMKVASRSLWVVTQDKLSSPLIFFFRKLSSPSMASPCWRCHDWLIYRVSFYFIKRLLVIFILLKFIFFFQLQRANVLVRPIRFEMNLFEKFTFPMKDCNSFLFFGGWQCIIVLVLLESISTHFSWITNPKNLISNFEETINRQYLCN
jgi:hypothetical protein